MTDLADVLSEPPEGVEIPHDPEERQRWAIHNYPPEARDKIATWAFRRLAAEEAEEERLHAAAETEVERIEAWAKNEVAAVREWEATARRPRAHDVAFFRGALIEYLLRIRDERGEDPERPKTLTYRLPTGRITGKRPPEAIEVLDEEKFIEWAEENGHAELVRVRKEVDKQAIRKATVAKDGVSVVIEGERLPFVEARRGPEKLDAKPEVSGG